MRPAVGGGLVLLALGCTGLLGPSVEVRDAVGFDCGDWEATLVASAPFGDTLELDVGGEARKHQWSISGSREVDVSGTATPGTELPLVARLGSAGTSTVIDLPPAPVSAHLEGDLREDRDGVLTLVVDNRCGVPLRWSVSGRGGIEASGELIGTDRTQVPVGQQPPGPLELQIRIEGEGATPVVTTAALVVAGPCEDRDGDGYGVCDAPVDCDDTDPYVNPGAAEKPVPNRVDDNCDGRVDEGTVAYDDDGDGYSEEEGDCDDTAADRHPGRPEVWDCRDQDCDGQVDDGVEPVTRADVNEPNDTREQATNLGGGNSLAVDVEVIRGAGDDPEWMTLYSHDGPFDDWGLGVRAVRIPDVGRWTVRLHDGGTVRRSGSLEADGDVVWLSGKPFRDDSGTFWVELRPDGVTEGCPATFRVTSR